MRLWVYGTLKRGFGNHPVLGSARYICDAETADRWSMLDAGFPVLIRRNDRALPCAGEVYELPEGEEGRRILAGLDRLESNGHMYHRMPIALADGTKATAYIGDIAFWAHQKMQPGNTDRVIDLNGVYHYVD